MKKVSGPPRRPRRPPRGRGGTPLYRATARVQMSGGLTSVLQQLSKPEIFPHQQRLRRGSCVRLANRPISRALYLIYLPCSASLSLETSQELPQSGSFTPVCLWHPPPTQPHPPASGSHPFCPSDHSLQAEVKQGCRELSWCLGGISQAGVSPVRQRSAPVTPPLFGEVGLGLGVPGRIPSGLKQ